MEVGDLVLTVSGRAARVMRLDAELGEAIVARLDDGERVSFRVSRLTRRTDSTSTTKGNHVDLPAPQPLTAEGDLELATMFASPKLVFARWLDHKLKSSPEVLERCRPALDALESGRGRLCYEGDVDGETAIFFVSHIEGPRYELFTVIAPPSKR